jgi:hypothetical protein
MSDVFVGIIAVLFGAASLWMAFTSKEFWAPFGPAEPDRRIPLWAGRIGATLAGILAVLIGLGLIRQGLRALK